MIDLAPEDCPAVWLFVSGAGGGPIVWVVCAGAGCGPAVCATTLPAPENNPAQSRIVRAITARPLVSGRADDKNLLLDARIDDDISIVADRRAVKQVIVNLLSNAVKFTPEGGRVMVRSHVLADSIVLMIADTGIGIAPHSLRKLGKPFEQVESQLTKTYAGSGLGLAIAKSLTSLHGGSMRLRSKLGTGTVVRVTLPRRGHQETAATSVAA